MKKIEFNKITWYSKLAATIFFVGILPAWTFFMGVQYDKTLNAITSSVFTNLLYAPTLSSPVLTTSEDSGAQCAPQNPKGIFVCTVTVSDGIQFTFIIATDPSTHNFTVITVMKNDKTVQTLNVGDNDGVSFSDTQFFVAQDMNFDGYKDIGLRAYLGATGNTSYYYWLYNPKTGLFEFNNDLSQMTNPTPDFASKEITTSSNGGDAGMIYENDTYLYQSAKYVLVESESQDEAIAGDGTKFRKIIKELKNGVMATTSDTIVIPDQNQN